MVLIAKAKKRLHALMNRLRLENEDLHFNFVRLEDPTEYVVCTPEGDMQGFKHLTNGDALMYFEIINSTPLKDDGYTIVDKRLVGLCRNSGKYVFTKESVFRFVDTVKQAKNIEVSQSWAIGETMDGMKIWYACGLEWMDASVWRRHFNGRELLWLRADFEFSRWRCCKCGCISTSKEDMCLHMKDMVSPIPRNRCVMSIKKVNNLYVS
jgi:hypothetical protein